MNDKLEKKQVSETQTYLINPGEPGMSPEKKRLFKPLQSLNSLIEQNKDSAFNYKNILGNIIASGDTCIFFACTNVGKSFFAYQLAQAVACGKNFFEVEPNDNNERPCYKLKNDLQAQTVIYADFEMSETQITKRYYSDGQFFQFHPNLKILTPAKLAIVDNLKFIQGMEADIKESGCKFLIIDNLSAISNNNEDGNLAVNVMRTLSDFKRKYDLTIIVISHTTKGKQGKIISIEDFAGSMMLGNLTDSCFAIGNTTISEDIKYIKQLKCRVNEKQFDTDNVIAIKKMEYKNGFRGFEFLNYENEETLIKYVEKSIKDDEKEQVVNLHVQFGMTPPEIAKDLHEKYGKDVEFDTYYNKIRKMVYRMIKSGKLQENRPATALSTEQLQNIQAEFQKSVKNVAVEQPETVKRVENDHIETVDNIKDTDDLTELEFAFVDPDKQDKNNSLDELLKSMRVNQNVIKQ